MRNAHELPEAKKRRIPDGKMIGAPYWTYLGNGLNLSKYRLVAPYVLQGFMNPGSQ